MVLSGYADRLILFNFSLSVAFNSCRTKKSTCLRYRCTGDYFTLGATIGTLYISDLLGVCRTFRQNQPDLTLLNVGDFW